MEIPPVITMPLHQAHPAQTIPILAQPFTFCFRKCFLKQSSTLSASLPPLSLHPLRFLNQCAGGMSSTSSLNRAANPQICGFESVPRVCLFYCAVTHVCAVSPVLTLWKSFHKVCPCALPLLPLESSMSPASIPSNRCHSLPAFFHQFGSSPLRWQNISIREHLQCRSKSSVSTLA
ncbi:MAG: hypothetical protein DDT37_01701 [Firmicutes bacterium]|nr:hypothetical protein [candidate division NPL-UPA2 bacterium]